MKLIVIIGSTRPGRIGKQVADWFYAYATTHRGFDVTLVDLVDVELPLLDEPNHPRLKRYQHDHTRRWSEIVGAADAYVFVTPEYNYGTSPALLNALDYLVMEWAYKPAGVVSYGGVSGGLRAAQHLKETLACLRMVTPPEGVPIPGVAGLIQEGAFTSNELIDLSAKTMLDELVKWADPLKALRAD